MSQSFSDKLAHVTGGRRYCFMVMTYHSDWHFFEAVRSIVGEATGLECIRADDILAPAEDLRTKIHSAIENAAFVIADISEERPSVYYEVGFAVARNKDVLLLAREGVVIPTDLLGVELIRYTTAKEGWGIFQAALRKHLAAQKGIAQVSLLRAMVIPRTPHPSYILASPKPPNPRSRFLSHPVERRTYGDHLGIRGILRAFGSVYGEHVAPELISAERADERLLEEDANFYLIGSPKVNGITRTFLKELQHERPPNWHFPAAPGEEEAGDYEVLLCGLLSEGPFRSQRRGAYRQDPFDDFGLIVRGPNPRFPARLVTIFAGPHSGGTGAACLAATNSKLIREITDKLPGGVADLANHVQTIWALVHVTPDPKDLHISPEGVDVVDAGVYEP